MENNNFESRLNPLSSEEIGNLFNGCVDVVARKLIGIFIVNEVDQRPGGKILETEAYCENDRAAHCHKGSFRFKRSDPMSRPGGYVYRHYSRGWCLNLVSGSQNKKFGSAVLIRSLQPIENASLLTNTNLCNGPVKLCKHLHLDRCQFNDKPLWQTSLRLYRHDDDNQKVRVKCGKRVGVSYKTAKEAADWPRNYVIDDDSLACFLSPGARRNIKREAYPPSLLQELKSSGLLAECVRKNGCAVE